MSARQPDLFLGDKAAPRMAPPERSYYRGTEQARARKPFQWTSAADLGAPDEPALCARTRER